MTGKARHVRKALPAALLVIGGALLAGCGGKSDLTLEEYFNELETLARRHRATAEALRNPDWARTFEEPELDEFRAAMMGARDAMSRFVVTAHDLDPPARARDEHRAIIEAGERYVDAYDDWLADTEDATTSKEIIDAPGSVEAGQASIDLTDACAALYELAEAHGISVDLRCGTQIAQS